MIKQYYRHIKAINAKEAYTTPSLLLSLSDMAAKTTLHWKRIYKYNLCLNLAKKSSI